MAGGAEGNRTPDLLIANEALSHLSYGPSPPVAAKRPGEWRPFTGSGRVKSRTLKAACDAFADIPADAAPARFAGYS